MATVSLNELTKTYPQAKGPGVPAVRGVSLEARHGEFMVLVGPSGCGKSTLLRMIAGLEKADGGTISIDGRVVNAVHPKDRDVAMVFQNYALFPHMTVFENMAFGLKFRKVTAKEIEKRVREAAAILHLDEYLGRLPRELSGGQRQRVAVGRAIVSHPKVFLFDEPLSNLDARMRVRMREELAKLHRRLGSTMIFVTHDQVEAMTLGERICVMNQGRIMQVGAPLELYRRPANRFVADFIGSPGMNFIRGTILEREGNWWFQEKVPTGAGIQIKLGAALAVNLRVHAGMELELGIRPEDIRVAAAQAEQPGATFRLRVDFTESLGHETLLHLHTGAHPLIARTGSSPAAEGSVTVRFEMERACFFDAVSQRSIGGGHATGGEGGE